MAGWFLLAIALDWLLGEDGSPMQDENGNGIAAG